MIKTIGRLSNKKYFLCAVSDTPEMVDYLRKKLRKYEIIHYSGTRAPQSTTSPNVYVNAATPADEAKALLETCIIEMLILSKAKYLISIGSPLRRNNKSGFIYYARNFIPARNCYYVIPPKRTTFSKTIVRTLKYISRKLLGQ